MEIEEKKAMRSEENIFDLLRTTRNNLIKDFLDERHMKDYTRKQYNIVDLSNVNIQLIKKDLMSLLLAPVDTSRYATLIEQLKQNNTASISDDNLPLFYREIEGILKKYIY
jgi:hypothetical protein